MLHAVIMAGGSGTRFWPESRKDRPKQLLKLAGDLTMIQATLSRLGDLVPPGNVIVATNEALVEPVAEQLPELSPESFIGEPFKRDTAPAIGLSAILVMAQDPDATMVIMPSDHVISPDEAFQKAISDAAAMVEAEPKRLVTFGIKPTYPAEIFGYIERGAAIAGPQGQSVYRVEQFREKPKRELAEEFLAAGKFYWNGGIFVWKAATILEELARHEPEMYDHLKKIGEAFGTPAYPSVLTNEFEAIKGKSIDFAVMEKAQDVVVMEADFQWDDVGSWQALGRLHGTNDEGNTSIGCHVAVSSKQSIVRSTEEHLVVTLGLDDVIVVHTPEATLVAAKDCEEQIRQVVKELEARGMNKFL